MNDSQLSVDEQNAAWAEWLWRRGVEPGVVRLAQAQATAVRLTQKTAPPLADEVSRRYAAVMAMQQQLPPIVYAEPMPPVQREAAAGITPKDGSPLPIVTASVAAGAAHPLPVSPARERPSTPIVQPAICHTQKPVSPSAGDRRAAWPGSAPVVPPTAAEPTTAPAVAPIDRPRSQAFPSARPAAPPAASTKGATAVFLPKTPITQSDVHNRPERPSPTPAALSLPVVRVVMPSPHPPALVQDVLKSRPAQVLPKIAQAEADPPGNGRTRLPVAREQASVAGPPAAPPRPQPLPQPLPLAQPVGSVIQRAAQETPAKETSASRPASSLPPTPTPNRVVRTSPVVQRATSDTGTAVSASGNEENESSVEATPAISNLDMDELVEKVHRRFLRRLVVEGERRGKTVWP